MSKVITISREFGSGGREIGLRLAQKLGVPFYDKEIIARASEVCNIPEEVFYANDEIIGDRERINHAHTTMEFFTTLYEVPVSDQLFVFQSQMIRKMAQEGPCVIIGRCSDIIVEDGVHVFICSSMKNRVERLMELEHETDAKAVESHIRKIDEKRRDYYQFYSGNEWGNPRNHHICLNSGKLGTDECVDIIIESLSKCGFR